MAKKDKESTAPKLLIEKIHKNVTLPHKPEGENTASGFDVYAYDVKAMFVHNGSNSETKIEGEALRPKFTDQGVFQLQQGERAMIGLGFKATVAEGYEIQMRPRSGLAWKYGLTVLNAPGTIDEDYREEVCAIIVNTSRKVQDIRLGDRIAQIVPAKVELLELEEAKLEPAKARKGGFGSTDKKDPVTFDDGMNHLDKMMENKRVDNSKTFNSFK
tara:strand:+ start:412 stop:1056 length:645 start_codon:yes stop_codon:yes gene_type:complete